MSEATTSTLDRKEDEASGAGRGRTTLVLVWSAARPDRLGEVLSIAETTIFGRGQGGLVRQRPRGAEVVEPYADPALSREQLRITRIDGALEIEAIGRRDIVANGVVVDGWTMREGDVFEIAGVCSFLCVVRPDDLPVDLPGSFVQGVFGEPDASGIVGESGATWMLRERIVMVAARDAHVLITGASGTGKELAAQAIHTLSRRHKKSLVARNASTFPSGIIDAELFGNVANYPNIGMLERPGLVGEADASSLFLDEIGELPIELQPRLLRVLDRGEYQRLGEAKLRTSSFRLIAATNRAPTALREDLAARFGLRVHVPPLNERREDIPLIARQWLRQTAASDPNALERFVDASGEPRLSAEFARLLVQRKYRTHIRELTSLLWESVIESRGSVLEIPAAHRDPIQRPSMAPFSELTADDVRASLARHDDVKDRVWRELGLPSRYALHRLMKKLGID